MNSINKLFGIGGGNKKTPAPAPAPAPAPVPAPVSAPVAAQVKSSRSGSGSAPTHVPAQAPPHVKHDPEHHVKHKHDPEPQVKHKHDPEPQVKEEAKPAPPQVAKSPGRGLSNPAVALQKPPIDWKEALKQVGDDRDFLNEVLSDLMEEAKTAEDDILDAINKEDYGGVMRAAHRIKGSASYLSCEPLKEISYTLQQSGHEGEEGKAKPELLSRIKNEYNEFKDRLKELREAVQNGIPQTV